MNTHSFPSSHSASSLPPQVLSPIIPIFFFPAALCSAEVGASQSLLSHSVTLSLVRAVKEPIRGSFKIKISLQVKKTKKPLLYACENKVAQHPGGQTATRRGY